MSSITARDLVHNVARLRHQRDHMRHESARPPARPCATQRAAGARPPTVEPATVVAITPSISSPFNVRRIFKTMDSAMITGPWGYSRSRACCAQNARKHSTASADLQTKDASATDCSTSLTDGTTQRRFASETVTPREELYSFGLGRSVLWHHRTAP